MSDPKRIGDLIHKILPGTLTPGTEELMSLNSRWTQLAGERLACHTKIFTLEKGHLVVDVDHPGWMQLFQLEQGRILKALQRQFPSLGIQKIRVRLIQDLDRPPSGYNAPQENRAPEREEPDPELIRLLDGLKKSLSSR